MTDTHAIAGRHGRDGVGAVALSAWHATRSYRPVLALLVVVLVYFSVTEPRFLTSTNVQNVFSATSLVWIVAMGMTLVLISAGLDLSVAATASLAGICLAKLLEGGWPGWSAVVLTVALGAVLGAVTNGLLIGPLKLSVFVVTLATLTSFTGIVNIWSGTQSTYVIDPIVNQLAIDSYLGIVAPIWVMGLVFLVAWYLQSNTYFGRDVFALGGSMQAARLSGIRPGRTIVGVYALAGGCAALAGVIGVGRTGAVVPQVDNTLALQAIAAVLLGGTSLTGGSGGVGGTAVGVLFLGFLQNGLSLNGVSSFWQQIVTGVILVAAVLLDRIERPDFRLRRARPAEGPSGVPLVPRRADGPPGGRELVGSPEPVAAPPGVGEARHESSSRRGGRER